MTPASRPRTLYLNVLPINGRRPGLMHFYLLTNGASLNKAVMRRSKQDTNIEAFTFWNSYYWLSIWGAILIAVMVHLYGHYRTDLCCDLAFALWTALAHAASRRWPFPARMVHALSVLPFLAYYFSLPDILVPANERAVIYIMLSFFPIYTVSAMSGLAGSVISLVVAAIAGYPLVSGSPTAAALSPLYWGLAAMIGYGHYALTSLLQKRYRQLQTMALSDPLTGLGNRRALEQDFPRYRHLAVREGKRLILTLWDINDLKKINDVHGHSFGDGILKKFARAVTGTARHSDPFYRIGGDEFAGLHIGIDNPNDLIRRIREKVPWVSAGWTDATHLSFEEAYERADQNMYTDKSTKPGDPAIFDIEQ